MKARKIFLYIDTTIQTVLIAVILVSIIIYSLGIGEYHDAPGYGVYATLILGVWQVASGLILAITTIDEWRIKYLIGVVLWFLSVFTVFMIFDIFPSYIGEPIAYLIYLAPYAFAIAYFRQTYLHLLKITSLPVSFWKL